MKNTRKISEKWSPSAKGPQLALSLVQLPRFGQYTSLATILLFLGHAVFSC